jgi:ankyrin repeat protein
MPLNAVELKAIRDRYPELRHYRSENSEEPMDPLTFLDPTGDSLLHIAVRAGDLPTVKLLARAGIDLDQIGDMGCAALHYAKLKSREDVYSFLVAHGASKLIRNEFGLLSDEINLE